MKKLLVLMMLLVLCYTSRAQVQTVLMITPGDKEVPQVVLDSVTKKFPSSVGRTISALSSQKAVQGWNVQVEGNLDEVEPLFYEVFVKSKTGSQRAIYDREGNLVKMKQVIKDPELPENVVKTISSNYADWNVVKKEERFTKGSKPDLSYKVNLRKGLLRKTLILNPEGSVKIALPV